ncbi:hypothetical protein T492DRAFT_603280 [Pavlovales sp. CCMP2436]|nr:hypothetical protein T492DRAFT_603280 [Pavlovales sp. CCMP2436]
MLAQAWIPFNSNVVTDGLLITGQNPSSPAAVAKAVVKALASQPPRDSAPAVMASQ